MVEKGMGYVGEPYTPEMCYSISVKLETIYKGRYNAVPQYKSFISDFNAEVRTVPDERIPQLPLLPFPVHQRLE